MFEIKNIVTAMKSDFKDIRRLEIIEEKITELEVISVGTPKFENKRE